MTRTTVLRVYVAFAVLLVTAIGFVAACHWYEDRMDAQQAQNWDAERNQWRDGYDWRAQNVTHERLVTARTGVALAVVVAALACAGVSGIRAIAVPAYWLPVALFLFIALALAAIMALGAAMGGGGMVGARRASSPWAC
jgi:hypothetical protein